MRTCHAGSTWLDQWKQSAHAVSQVDAALAGVWCVQPLWTQTVLGTGPGRHQPLEAGVVSSGVTRISAAVRVTDQCHSQSRL